QQVVQATEDGEQLNIEMTYVPQEPGQYKLTLQIPQQEGEPIVDNNLQTAYVNVLEGGLRVLFLDSNVVWQEQKFLRRSIDESVDIQLDWQWLDVRLRQQWPVNLAQIVGGNNYDVYLLGDVPAAALGSEGCRLLAQQVQSGKGLMMCGGYHSFGPGGYADTALRDVLPIEMLRSESQPFGAEPWPDSHLQRPLAMRPSDEDHFVTRLGGRDDNLSVWRRLPPLDEANKFGRLKPAAVVIAKAETGEPLLVQGNSGNGRVLAFAGDSTYRWYRHGFQAEHKRFWRQAILWLARKDESQRQNVWVQLDQRRVLPGGSVKLTTGATNANGDIIEDSIFETILHAPDGTQQAIRVSPDGESWTGTCEDLALPGDYRLQVKARRGGADIGSAESNFVVVQQDLELLEPAANPQFMAMLSQLTADSGGKTVAPEQMPALFHDIATQPPRTEVTRQTKWQLATTPLDTWLYFLTLIALISSEWFLRKKWGMV
ncbi:MAG: hypothetical protein KDA99_26875, partial [Planctomycetales bacterium]|nr:hypothetical protein [Planctomycetales bacterium]